MGLGLLGCVGSAYEYAPNMLVLRGTRKVNCIASFDLKLLHFGFRTSSICLR